MKQAGTETDRTISPQKRVKRDDSIWAEDGEDKKETVQLLPGAIAHTIHTLCTHPALYGRLTGLVGAGGFKSTKSMWLSKFQKQQESEAAAAATAAGGVKQEDAQVNKEGLCMLLAQSV